VTADRPILAAITLVLVCVSAYVAFKILAFVAVNGWRSMLGLVALRGKAVLEWQDDSDDIRANMSTARNRANNYAGSVLYWRHVADQQATRLHLAEVGRDEDLDRLIAAGRTISELRAALAIASRQIQHLEAKALQREGNPS
jgi:hypothetical protein